MRVYYLIGDSEQLQVDEQNEKFYVLLGKTYTDELMLAYFNKEIFPGTTLDIRLTKIANVKETNYKWNTLSVLTDDYKTISFEPVNLIVFGELKQSMYDTFEGLRQEHASILRDTDYKI